MRSQLHFIGVFLLFAAVHGPGIAQSHATQYVNLAPAFVTNYGSSSKIRYIKVDMAVRVQTAAEAARVEHHLPYLRNNLLLLLHQQTDTELNSAQGRNQLRARALHEIQEIMQQEEGRKVVSEVLFSNFIVEG